MEMGGGGGEMVAVPGGEGVGGGFGGRGGGEGALVIGECWSVRSGGGGRGEVLVSGTNLEIVDGVPVKAAEGGVGVPGVQRLPGGLGTELTTGNLCQVCGRWFRGREELSRHVRTHTGEKPYVCPYCPYSAAQKGNVVMHARMKHDPTMTSQQVLVRRKGEGGGGELVGGVSVETVDGEANRAAAGGVGVPSRVGVPGGQGVPGGLGAELTSRLVCQICGQRSCYPEGLTRHMRTHTGEKPYVCPYCPYRAGNKSNVVRHAQMKHDPTMTSRQVLVRGGGGGGHE